MIPQLGGFYFSKNILSNVHTRRCFALRIWDVVETRVKDLLASGVPPKGLEARAFTFGGTEGSMLGRRGWFDAVTKRFDAGKKGMV